MRRRVQQRRVQLRQWRLPQQPASAFTASAFTAPAFTASAVATSASASEPQPFDSVIVAVVPLDERELQVLLLQGKFLLTIACRVLLCEQLQFLRTGRLPFEILGRVSF